MKKKLFQFAILYHETQYKENNRTEVVSSILVPPDTVIAQDERVALMMIAKKIPDSHQDKLQDVEVLLRPF